MDFNHFDRAAAAAPIILVVNFDEATLYLSDGALRAISWPQQLQIMINDEKHSLLVRPCKPDDAQAFEVPNSREAPLEISERSIVKRIRNCLDRDVMRSVMASKAAKGKGAMTLLACYGETVFSPQAVVFNLSELKPLDEISLSEILTRITPS